VTGFPAGGRACRVGTAGRAELLDKVRPV